MANSIKISAKFNTVDKMRAGIKSVLNRANTWRIDVQLLAVATINHAHEHGDWTLLRDLVVGVTKTDGINKTKLKMWAEEFMNAELVENSDGESIFAFHKGKGVKDIDVDAAAAVNWYEYKAPKVEEKLDLDTIHGKMAKLMVRAMKQGSIEKEQAELIMAGIQSLCDAQVTEIEVAEAA